MELVKLKKVTVRKGFNDLLPYLTEIHEQESKMIAPLSSIKLPKQISECLDTVPNTIFDLKDGKLFRYFEVKQGQEALLGALGFKLNISSVKKALIVEYFQTGSHICNKKKYNYGVGARMLLKVETKKMGAKLDSPERITASVIFEKASVSYEWRTFGITGPGVDAYFGTAGKLNDNTYNNFFQGVSKLFESAYRKDKKVIIFPVPLIIND